MDEGKDGSGDAAPTADGPRPERIEHGGEESNTVIGSNASPDVAIVGVSALATRAETQVTKVGCPLRLHRVRDSLAAERNAALDTRAPLRAIPIYFSLYSLAIRS